MCAQLTQPVMTNAQDWQAQVGHNWARMYRQTDRSFTGLTQRLLERLEAVPGREVLDIGCGAGELSLALARARPGVRVTGLDISEDLLAVARERGAGRPDVDFELADAAQWSPPRAPDLMVSRHGVMFFADPVAAFTHMRATAAPGASLLFSCFRSPAENPWASAIAALLPAAPPPAPGYAPGPFAFADTDFVRGVLGDAGWKGIDFEAVDYAYIAGQGADPVADAQAFLSVIGPFAHVLRALEGEAREIMLRRLRVLLERHAADRLVAFPAAAWIVRAEA
jgi:SAM-dependent methyltransferase